MRKFMILSLVAFIHLTLYSQSDFKLKKNLNVQKNTTYRDGIVSLGGELDIQGTAEQSIIMIGGSLRLDGQVNQDVICFATDVTLGKDAWIKGELMVIGGELSRDTLSRVNGEFFYFRFDLKKIESTLIPIISDSKTISFLRIIKVILWLILTLLVLAIIPQKVNLGLEIFDKNILKIGLVGLLSMFCFLFLLVVFIILIFFIIGIPLILLLIVLYFALLIFGRTVMFCFIGNKISSALHLRITLPSLFLLLGAVFYTLLKFLPVAGPILLTVMNIFELGIGVGYVWRKKLSLKNQREC